MRKIFFPSSKPEFIDPPQVVPDLKNLSRKIARRRPDIESVYLFGSYAWGTAGARSDADILVILKHSDTPMKERLDEFLLAFSEGPVPVDVLVYTRSEIDAALATENRFLKRAMKGLRLV
jgi:predicted nucleotidyltransferase